VSEFEPPQGKSFVCAQKAPGEVGLEGENMLILFECSLWNMNNVTIRPARDDDAISIESMIYQCIRIDKEHQRVASIREALQRDGQEIIVAELGGKIIGVLHFILYPDVMLGDWNSHIIFLLVDEGSRGKGVGTKLLEKAAERAKEQGAVEIHVDTIYAEAERFYRERGFKDDGVMLERALLTSG
jgi:GNAT superfamily N-acetyltransferase